ELPWPSCRQQAKDRQGLAEAQQVELVIIRIFRPATIPDGTKRRAPMSTLIQLLVSGLATGAIYALIAVGFTLLWQTSQTINFAQGEFVMLPAFFVLIAMGHYHMAFWAAGGAAALVAVAPLCARATLVSVVALGVLFKRLMVDPMIHHGVLPLVIATIGLAILM